MNRESYDRIGTSVFRSPNVADATRRLKSCGRRVDDIERVQSTSRTLWRAETDDGLRDVEWDGARWTVSKVAALEAQAKERQQ